MDILSYFVKFKIIFLWKENRVFSKAEAWIDLLLEAQYSEETTMIVIKFTSYEQYQGETVKTMKTWAKRWGWGRSRVRRLDEC